METQVETPTRERWREVLSQYSESDRGDHRRCNQRAYVQFGVAKLSFDDEQGMPDVRTGRLLNASHGGVMIKQYQSIPAKTELQIEATIGDETFALAGHVVHATETLGGFKIGIELRFTD